MSEVLSLLFLFSRWETEAQDTKESFQWDTETQHPTNCPLRETVSCSTSNSDWVRDQDFQIQGLGALYTSIPQNLLKISFILKPQVWRWRTAFLQMAPGWKGSQNSCPPALQFLTIWSQPGRPQQCLFPLAWEGFLAPKPPPQGLLDMVLLLPQPYPSLLP